MSRGSASRSDMLIVFPAFITAGCFLPKVDVDREDNHFKHWFLPPFQHYLSS